MTVLNEPRVLSPCQSICLLNDENVCTGCGRTGMEISYWGRFSTEQQRQVVTHAAQRLQGQELSCVWQQSQEM